MASLDMLDRGSGELAVFIHGSYGWGADTFPEQLALADRYRVVLLDRRGFGDAPVDGVTGWPVDLQEVTAILEAKGKAHLIGHSYGAVVALLVAGARPDLVRSLVVIEPPLYGSTDDPMDHELAKELRELAEVAPRLTAAEYVTRWSWAVFRDDEDAVEEWTRGWASREWSVCDATRREAFPGAAPVDRSALAALTVPKVVVRGGWSGNDEGSRRAGSAFRAIAAELSISIGAQLVECSASSHNPQLTEASSFNDLLLATWSSAQAHSSDETWK